MVRIIFDTETRRFSIGPSDESKDLKGISREFIHNCIRIIERPCHPSVRHWLEEMFAFTSKTLRKPSTIKRRPIEQLFNEIGNYSNNPKLFYFVKESIEGWIREIENENYGPSNEYNVDEVSYGLWILYRSFIPPKRVYSETDLIKIYKDWSELMIEEYYDWERLSGISRRSVRLFSGNKVFSFRLNY